MVSSLNNLVDWVEPNHRINQEHEVVTPCILPERILLWFSHVFTLSCMYIESVIWNRNRVTPDIIYPLFYINILSIIDEVLQMIRITILSTFTKENNSFTDKYPPFGFSSSLVYQLMPLPQCFYLFSNDSIAIFSTNGKQTLPHIVAVPTRPKFQCKKPATPVSARLMAFCIAELTSKKSYPQTVLIIIILI